MRLRRKADPRSMRILRRRGVADPYAEDVEASPVSERESREDALSLAAANQVNRFYDGGLDYMMSESSPRAKEYIEKELFPGVGYDDADSTKDAWSAATVSNLAKAFDPEFEGSTRHSDYIRRGFRGKGNYRAEKAKENTDFQVGDILFQGRTDADGNPIGPQTYRDFKRDAKGKGEYGDMSGYGSHSDIIVGTGVDEDGRKYYNIQGGNVGDKLRQRKLYQDQVSDYYRGRLTQ